MKDIDKVEAKAEQLPKDKRQLKNIHQHVLPNLLKLCTSFTHMEKENNAVVSEWTRLSGKVDRL